MTLGDAKVGSTVVVTKIEGRSEERRVGKELTNAVLWTWA